VISRAEFLKRKLQSWSGLQARQQAAILNHMVQYPPILDASFAALADPTRRGILERLGHADTSISELAELFGMTLTGLKKHVHILEAARLVTTEKIGRVRMCRLGPRRLEEETAWIATYQQMLNDRFNRLEAFLERTKGDQP
jgi:DNA-binding transcriptional ArsR family regulator